MRQLVGQTDDAAFDNPTGLPVFADLAPDATQRVFDFGCGCGRVARQLMQQEVPPARYLGIDLHAGMVEWCAQHLAPRSPQFAFVYHDVNNAGLNPAATDRMRPFPAEDGAFTLVLAISVFTHMSEDQAVHYLHESRRILAPGGCVRTTWFLFDKREFPMMQRFQNALFVNENDPSNAVIFDRQWLIEAVADAGLRIVRVTPPSMRGFHWFIDLEHAAAGLTSAALPEDVAPYGAMPPPVVTRPAHEIGGADASVTATDPRPEPPPTGARRRRFRRSA
jgi:SAM-dependent methyltransferase